jgi:hypothetical protein
LIKLKSRPPLLQLCELKFLAIPVEPSSLTIVCPESAAFLSLMSPQFASVGAVEVAVAQVAPLLPLVTPENAPCVAALPVSVAALPPSMAANRPAQMASSVNTVISAMTPLFRKGLGAGADEQHRANDKCAYHSLECTDLESHLLPPQCELI